MATKYNLSKIAKKDDNLQPYSSRLQDQNKEMKIDTKESDAKNINLKLEAKDKDNSVPFDKQLEASRTNKDGFVIVEKAIDKSDLPANKREMQNKKITVSPINVLSEEFDQKKVEAIKKAEGRLKNDTAFWDKYVGEQLLGKKTTVDTTNTSNSQLQNQPDRFSFNKETDVTKTVDTKISKMAMQTLKDADALLLQVYTTAAVENRELTKNEQAFVKRINQEKEYVIAQGFLGYNRDDGTGIGMMEDNGSLLIRVENDGDAVVYENGQQLIDENGKPVEYTGPNSLENLQNARDDYPEADVEQQNV